LRTLPIRDILTECDDKILYNIIEYKLLPNFAPSCSQLFRFKAKIFVLITW